MKVLKALFKKQYAHDGTEDKNLSYWEVWDNEMLILTITVRDIKKQGSFFAYEDIATEHFGHLLLGKVKRNKVFM